MKIPKKIEKEREFWDRHSITEFLDELEFVDVKFVKKSPMVTLSFRIEKDKAEQLKALARRLNVPYTVFIREVIYKALERDGR